MTERPSLDDMRVEVVGSEVRIVFIADSEEQARRIGRSVAAKVKAARSEPANDMEEVNGASD